MPINNKFNVIRLMKIAAEWILGFAPTWLAVVGAYCLFPEENDLLK